MIGYSLSYDVVCDCCLAHVVSGRLMKKGSLVKALVLDVSLPDNLVDLSLKSELLNKIDGKASATQPSKKVCSSPCDLFC